MYGKEKYEFSQVGCGFLSAVQDGERCETGGPHGLETASSHREKTGDPGTRGGIEPGGISGRVPAAVHRPGPSSFSDKTYGRLLGRVAGKGLAQVRNEPFPPWEGLRAEVGGFPPRRGRKGALKRPVAAARWEGAGTGDATRRRARRESKGRGAPSRGTSKRGRRPLFAARTREGPARGLSEERGRRAARKKTAESENVVAYGSLLWYNI